MKKSTYWEKLKDPRWQRKRLEVMSSHGFRCCECGESDSTLNVHHLYYVSRREPWEYPKWCFVTLCEPCHKSSHVEPDHDEVRGFSEWEEALGFILPKGSDMSHAGPGCNFVWTVGVEIAQALEEGASEGEIINSLNDLRTKSKS